MPARIRWSSCLVLLLLTLVVQPVPVLGATDPPHVVIEEVVTDPEQDHDGSGSVTTSDEYVVLLNAGAVDVDLTGWRLTMDDSTPEEATLDGTIPAGGRHVVLNPRGAMNNDVRLVLHDADGTTLVDHTLGANGLPGGAAVSRHDEAVYLAGPWAGRKAPASFGHGLQPVWVEAVSASGAPTPTTAFVPRWLPGGSVDLELILHRAPGFTEALGLAVSGRTYPIVEDNGTGRVEAVALAPPEAWLVVKSTGSRVSTWPNASGLVFPVDDTPPFVETSEAVSNATRHLHHLPPVHDPQSGATVRAVHGIDVHGTPSALPACMLPTPTAPASCRIPAEVHTLRIEAENGAGALHSGDVPLIVDPDPPVMPDTFVFETATPPRLGWPRSTEPLQRLDIETSDDTSGTWNVTRIALADDATAFTDHAWTPGADRAYRLVGIDRAGNTNATPWVPLPPEAVPVTATMPDAATAHEDLLANGTVSITVHFDRPLRRLPTLVLASTHPEAFDLQATGIASPDQRSVHYAVAANGTLPLTARASWRLADGQGIDGAPVRTGLADVEWDHEPPTIQVTGTSDAWIAGSRHVLTFTARDRGDPHPVLKVSGDERAEVRSGDGITKVAVDGEGNHTIRATAVDHHGNRAEGSWEIRLDAAAPHIRLDTSPTTLGPGKALVLVLGDDASGVAPETLQVSVRTTSGVLETAARWEGDRVRVTSNATAAGPFEVRVRVSDQAGNVAEGLLGTRLPASLGMNVLINGPRGSLVANTTASFKAANDTSGLGGHSGPTVGGAAASWSDVVEPVWPGPEPGDAARGSFGTTLLSAFAAAGAVGLGTAVVRKRRGAPVGGPQDRSVKRDVSGGASSRDESSATR